MKKQIIIIGSGASVKEGISKGLWKKIKNKYVVGLNYSFYHFPNPTFQCFVDDDFYDENYKSMGHLSLVIGNKKKLKKQLFNTFLLPTISSKYYRDIKHGVYKSSLVGIWALSLTIYLAEPGDEIYLLGYDYGEARKSDYTKFATTSQELNKIMIKDKKGKALTHYYQGEINHRGIGKINYYNSKNRAEKDYGCYKKIKNIKIYNVSLISKIPKDIFPQISYDEFFKKLNNKTYNQKELKKEILKKLKWAEEKR